MFLHAECRISCFNERERAFNERERAFNLRENNSRHIVHVRVEYTKRSIVKEDMKRFQQEEQNYILNIKKYEQFLFG